MTTNHQPGLDSFEASLLTELRGEVARRGADGVPASRPKAVRRGLQLSGTAALATAAALGVIGLAGGPGASAAYAVDREADGDIVITLNALKDPEGLERELAGYGIDAEVDYEATPDMGGPIEFSDGELPPGATLEQGSGSMSGYAEVEAEVEASTGGEGAPAPDAGPCGELAPAPFEDGLKITIPVELIDDAGTLKISGAGDNSFGSIEVSYSLPGGGGCGMGVAQASAR